ncbi:MAG TPA: cupredoxin domain-containing protein [Candidatus Thermoplasmatota archaeon]|nr:cupredoxin domain-containing protein [Candidatus Thermoplasmatota archaeon]
MRGVLALLLLATLIAPTVHAEDRRITVLAKETGCPGGAPYCWEPQNITVNVGDNVTLVYKDEATNFMSHNLAVLGYVNESTPIRDPGGAQANDTITFTATEAGEIPFICDVHPQMKGTIVVASEATNAPTPAPGLALLAAGGALAALLARRIQMR